jgi:hypothetical protein
MILAYSALMPFCETLACIGGSAIKRQVEARTQSKPLKAVLDGIRLVFQEANVLMLEGFFQYAIPKYQVVLGCIDFAAQNPVLMEADSEVYAKAIRDSLKQVCFKRECYACLSLQ